MLLFITICIEKHCTGSLKGIKFITRAIYTYINNCLPAPSQSAFDNHRL